MGIYTHQSIKRTKSHHPRHNVPRFASVVVHAWRRPDVSQESLSKKSAGGESETGENFTSLLARITKNAFWLFKKSWKKIESKRKSILKKYVEMSFDTKFQLYNLQENLPPSKWSCRNFRKWWNFCILTKLQELDIDQNSGNVPAPKKTV